MTKKTENAKIMCSGKTVMAIAITASISDFLIINELI